MENIIELHNICKEYKLFDSPHKQLLNLISKVANYEKINALTNISFNIRRGQAVGVIGDNGAGKSTLLKIIAKVISPTTGKLRINGSVASILELGCGFHPEFTGAENARLYGELLGVSKKKLQKKILQIKEFSELDTFFEKPIKTYSSGMITRLAFAVVTLLDADIIIIDEALSVGDLYFQSKCSKKILELKQKGKTILFCSHSMYQVALFCDTVIWLENGQIKETGSPDEVIPHYEYYQNQKHTEKYTVIQRKRQDIPFLNSFEIVSKKNEDSQKRFSSELEFLAEIKGGNQDVPYHFTLSIKMDNGRGIFVTGTNFQNISALTGDQKIKVKFPHLQLLSGIYQAHARILDETASVLYSEKIIPKFSIQKTSDYLGICYLEHEIICTKLDLI